MVQPHGKQGLLGAVIGQPLHCNAIFEAVESRDKTLDQPAVAIVEPIPFRTSGKGLEEFDLIAAPGHRIGEPGDRVLQRKIAPVSRPVYLDTVDCSRLALLRRRVGDFLFPVRIKAHFSMCFGFRDLRRDLTHCAWSRFDDHDAQIIPTDNWRPVISEQRRHRTMAFCPCLPAKNDFHEAHVTLRLGAQYPGNGFQLSDKRGLVCTKFPVTVREEILPPTTAICDPRFFIVFRVENDLYRTSHLAPHLHSRQRLASQAGD
ncbi:MAG: hypothetical protein LKM31_07950 [Sphingobium sp.]|uniref:hypothetical protein n=1 Tax=Sphingomonas sp. 28-62-20 TaxID=1970433 RepID=UPI0035A81F47|nr:hypothetical protein [Sphingobium sp.]